MLVLPDLQKTGKAMCAEANAKGMMPLCQAGAQQAGVVLLQLNYSHT